MMTTTNISDSCANILNSIRSSALNYSFQETPYSMYVTIRKSWSKQNQSLQVPVPVAQVGQVDEDRKVAEIDSLKLELINVKADLEIRNNINNDLKIKIEAAVVESDRHNVETEKMLSRKDDEIKLLKNEKILEAKD